MLPGKYIKVSLWETKNLVDELDQDNGLIILMKSIDWECIVAKIERFYNKNYGAPALPIRMMVGLVILKYIECLSDEKLISRCTQDKYYQAFIGRTSFVKSKPCDRTLLSVFRKRIGKEGAEIILQNSIVINGKSAVEEVKKELIIDSTVQEKFTAFPTDTKLTLDVIHQCWRIAAFLKIHYRLKFEFEVNKLRKDSAFNKSNKRTEIRENNLVRLREIGLILLNELNKKIGDKLANKNDFDYYYKNYYKALTQKKDDSNKIYSIFEPQIYCIAKGKQNKKYEFGTKVVVITGKYNHIIYYIESLNSNINDSKTIENAIDNLEKRFGCVPQGLVGDLGYRGAKTCKTTIIITPDKIKNYAEKKDAKIFKEKMRRRSDIEEIISHLKNEFRLDRNRLRGTLGDIVNPILAAAASNYKTFIRNEIKKLAQKKRQNKKTEPDRPRRLFLGTGSPSLRLKQPQIQSQFLPTPSLLDALKETK